ncbi:dipeptidase [Amycolatopsis sp. Hca4]|uniref:dipeptidase n=1 Tax=Amycolatopsis sp. Hca4 TaxID=2742131 RepID=UPI001C37C1F5|nr:dipeptidase [Amycolatopsis sp. Hca4]
MSAVELRKRIDALMPRARAELADLVAIRSVADPRQFPPEECHRAAAWVAGAFTEAGFDTHLADTPDGSRSVIGTRLCGREDAPTVLLYAHYDVQPPLADAEWRTPPFRLSEVDGRWYGRGAADCKGNILMHLTALRALGTDVPVHLKLVVEGSEEQGTGGLEAYVPEHADLLRADAIVVADTGNAAVGHPAVTVSLRGLADVVVHVDALPSELHSGMFGGPAPDALAALVTVLATLRDEAGDTTVHGLPAGGRWPGAPYPAARFRADAGLSPGAVLLGSGEVADTLWARPAVTVLGIDCPPVVGSTAALTPRASARLNLRVPPGTDPYRAASALSEHLMAAAPWGVDVSVEVEGVGEPFLADTGGPAHRAMDDAMQAAYGRPVSLLGQGGSIPLCTVFAETYPDAEILLIGVEEPQARIHAPNESVDPREIAAMALTEALFLRNYGAPAG